MTPDETRALLERLEELEKKATPGPWHGVSDLLITTEHGARLGCAIAAKNLHLIAETRNALPDLLRLARLGVAVETEDLFRPSGESIFNREGALCGLCDGSYEHEHVQVECVACGQVLLPENKEMHLRHCKANQRASDAGGAGHE